MPTSSKIKKMELQNIIDTLRKLRELETNHFHLTCVNAKKWEKSEIRIKCIENTCQFCVRRGW